MKANPSLGAICDDIELITGIKTVIYDENRHIICAYPNGHCAFCEEIRRSEALTAKCLQCDAHGFTQSDLSRDIHIYRCHMGLVEAVAPVIENGRTIGYLMLGQLLPKGGREHVRAQISALSEDVDKDALGTYLEAMQETDDRHLRAVAHLLAMSAAYVRVHEWMRKPKGSITYEIERYAFENLSNMALTAQSVGVALGLSRTSLYKLCMESFGMGMGEYIRKMRADEAARLLRTTDLPFARIAEQVGLSTPARLTRLLRAQTGQSAREIRAAAKNARNAR
ncbi:MAG: PocR ligand-binding domain-containing protein [Clostridia bacterium]|nr:PocR ligand-binding domain-containing protein [Clostridia bacterium]